MFPTKEEWNRALEERHGKEIQEKFAGAVVAVCGLGGLGSNIAIALARAGIGKLILIDFDKVDLTNLHRQQYKPAQIGMYKTEHHRYPQSRCTRLEQPQYPHCAQRQAPDYTEWPAGGRSSHWDAHR